MKRILKTDFELIVLKQKLKYNQYSLRECIEYTNIARNDDFNIEDWLYDFLKDRINISKLELKKLDTWLLIKTLYSTLFRWFFAEWTWSSWWKTIPYSAYIMFLADWDITKINSILDLTPTLIEFWLEWKIYNINEQSKEGQKRNKINSIRQDLKSWDIDKDLEDIKQMREKLKARNK